MKKMFQTLKTAFGLLARDIWAGKIVILILLISIHITKMLFWGYVSGGSFTGLPCPGVWYDKSLNQYFVTTVCQGIYL